MIKPESAYQLRKSGQARCRERCEAAGNGHAHVWPPIWERKLAARGGRSPPVPRNSRKRQGGSGSWSILHRVAARVLVCSWLKQQCAAGRPPDNLDIPRLTSSSGPWCRVPMPCVRSRARGGEGINRPERTRRWPRCALQSRQRTVQGQCWSPLDRKDEDHLTARGHDTSFAGFVLSLLLPAVSMFRVT